MVKTILLLFLLIFSVLGISEFVFFIKMLFYFPGKRFETYTFITLKKGYSLLQLEYNWQKIRWQGDGYSNGILALIDNLETKEIYNCNKYIKNKNIILCKKDELPYLIDFQGDLFNERH